MVIVTAVLFSVVCAVAYVLPTVYRSEATILVESQRIPTGLAQATITAQAAERIQRLRQRMMTRDNLLSIAREFDLFTSDKIKISSTDIVDIMRRDAQIEQINVKTSGRSGTEQAIAFTVAFEYRQPAATARVANRFVELILEQNIQSRTARALETREFFDRQLKTRREEFRNIEQRIIKFKNENRDSLPDTLSYRRDRLTSAQSELSDIVRKLASLAEETKLLEARAKGDLSSSVIDSDSALTPQEKELRRLQILLAQLRGAYSESHPDVRRINAQIAALDKASNLTSTSDGNAEDTIDRQASAFETKISYQLDLAKRQIDFLEKNRVILEKRIQSINETIARTPEVEASLTALTNERSTLMEQQRQLATKSDLAAVGERLEQNRQAERFEVLEQATVPSEPIKPNRPLIVLGGVFASLGAGIGIILLLELMDPTLRGAKALEGHFQVRPIVSIPYIETDTELAARKRKTFATILIGLASIVAILFVVHTYYLPLDVIVEKMLIEARKIAIVG